ncbi:MAG: two-component regulator propeller domain-containing protein [Bacteroidota bacterium]
MKYLFLLSNLAVFSLFVNAAAQGQHIEDSAYFERITVKDGLSFNAVRSILQDTNGFFWFGTQEGLNRYDGREFKVYRSTDEGIALSNDRIRYLLESEDGVIWIGSDGGLSSFDPRREEIENYTNEEFFGENTVVNTLANSVSNRIWIGTDTGVLVFDYTEEEVVSFDKFVGSALELKGASVNAIYEDSYGRLWIGSDKGVYAFDLTGEEISGFNDDPILSIVGNNVSSIYEDSKGDLWFGTLGDGLYKFDRELGVINSFVHDPSNYKSLSSDFVKTIYESSDGRIWVGTNAEGLNLMRDDGESFIRFQHDLGNEHSLSNNAIYQLTEDTEGRIWIATWNGINKLYWTREIFVHHKFTPGVSDKLNHNLIMPMVEDDEERLWIATFGGGVNVFDRVKGEYAYLKHDESSTNSLSSDDVWAICRDSDGVFWFGTWGEGIDRYDPASGEFKNYKNIRGNANSLNTPTNRVYSIMEDSFGLLWIGTLDGGVSKFDSKNEVFSSYTYDDEDSRSIGSNEVNKIFEDHDSNLWFGTYRGGLSKYNRVDDNFETYRLVEDSLHSIGSNFVTSINEYPDGVLWIGTQGGGLSRLEVSTGVIDNFGNDHGLPGNSVLAILIDERGLLWLSTYLGIARFDPATSEFRVFDTRDGLQSNIFHIGSSFKSKSGEFFFGGNNGFNSFFPEYIKDDSNPPVIRFTDLKIDGETQLPNINSSIRESIVTTDEIVVEPDQFEISIGYAALHYKNPLKNEYSYFLEGYHSEWRHVGTEKVITFPRAAFSPGTYTFSVKASNGDGIWNEEGISIEVVILAPWYQKWWAWMLWVSLAGLGIFGLVRWRVRAAEQRAEQLEVTVQERTTEIAQQNKQLAQQAHQLKEMDRIRSNFFANISHEFRTPLTTIIGPVQDTLNGVHGKLNDRTRTLLQIVERSGKTLKGLIDQLLALSKLEAGEMLAHPRQVDLVAYVQHRLKEFELPASGKSIALTFEHDGSASVLYLDTDKLKYIFNNLLSNAIKFTPSGGQISVGVARKLSTKEVLFTVTDTGIGISAEVLPHIFKRFRQGDASSTRLHEGTGIGLALTRELVNLHQATIGVESEVGVGSTFTVSFKQGRAHFSANSVLPGIWMPELRDDLEEREEEEALMFAETPLPDDAPRVLLVEDREDVRTYIRSLLEGRYHVFEAENGRIGLERAIELLPDLIVSDVMMPEVDGLEMVKSIKTTPALAETRVMLVTARADMEDIHAGLRTGADAYIVKPFNATEFQIRVENLIEVRKAIAANRVSLETNGVEVDSKDEAFIKQVRELIVARMQDIKVSDIAAELGVSPRHLNRLMHSAVGLTARVYLQILRLERAAQLLEQKHDQVAQIAYAVGYSDPNHFSRVFRQAYDVSPKEYMEGKRGRQ